jgi:hypothetical protein
MLKKVRFATGELNRILFRNRAFDPIPFEPIQPEADLRRIDCAPALFDPGMLERVVACGFKSDLERETAKLRATSWQETPTQRCELRDVLVLGGRILTRKANHYAGPKSAHSALRAPVRSYTDVTVPNTVQGLMYFGHWLRDDCAAYELGRDMGREIISLRRPSWSDCAAYEALFDQTWPEHDALAADSMLLIRDIGFNLDKRRRLERLRARVQASGSADAGWVYLKRGPGGKARGIANESELVARLAAEGVRIVEPEQGGRALIESGLGAELIITVEGSQAAHALYLLRPGGSLLIIQPPDRFYNPHVEWTRMIGMRYGLVVGRMAEGGMTVPPDEILEMAERLTA